ncbi:DEKNAAC102390 [Brettanomyces naardenensis]|uniref:Phosphomevalonate kinase n=1 Tax=Brettanomyces naardenensis TaxID=13370 RepID=A0A448YLD7_BRENA|nr:DEKNAAC102390 [Brettanomyces naardenensis]
MLKVFSCPGKALLAGGYLVLDPDYEAFVVALSARMHAAITLLRPLGQSELTKITVKSPQFKGGLWSYHLDINKLSESDIVEAHGRNNPFVKTTILTVLSYLKPTDNYEIEITIFSDSGYHTQAGSTAKVSNNGTRRFYYHDAAITEVPKTGLGSSAGLVTSLTSALLCCYLGPNFLNKTAEENAQTLNCLHNLSQVAHCIAQGKVGSGFDVAAATYGSVVYRRFKPELITRLMELDPSQFSNGLKELVDNADWKIVHRQCSLVPGIRILMGDVAGGSETPKLVSKVLKWRKENPERALQVWTNLNNSNMKLVESLEQLRKSSKSDYSQTLDYLNTHSASEIVDDNLSPGLLNIINCIKHIRHWLKLMSIESGAEIEPDEQTRLLDRCEALKGSLGGVVPGAGGYDAICLLVAEDSIDRIITDTKNDEEFKRVNWLQLEDQKQGLIEEKIEDFEGLIHIPGNLC